MKFVRIPLAALSILALPSCGGGGGGGEAVVGPPPPPPPAAPAPVASVTVSPATATLFAGESREFTAVTRDLAGNALAGRQVSWASSTPTVATVSPTTGIVTGVATGTATITATSEGKSGPAEVSVVSLPIVAFTSVATGGAHTCALTTAGAAYCWGRGESGQLGVPPPSTTCPLDSPPPFPCSLIPVPVAGGLAFTRLAAGGAHTCGLTSDGSAHCWGSNTSGQLGDNSGTNRHSPVPVATGVKFESLDAGADHTCGLTSDGTSYCWGRNNRGQLGDGSTSPRLTPVRVAEGLTFKLLVAGGFSIGHTCGLTQDGTAYCWGDNERGQLGTGSADLTAHPVPAAVTGGLTFVSLTAGLGRHTCGITAVGAAYCWGENSFGALGNGSSTDSPVPVQVSGGQTFAKLVAGGFIGHSCGVTTSGAAYCWGDNDAGALGDGTQFDRFSPSLVSGALSWENIDAGFRHTCGRTSAGILYCWGSGRAGQLGNNFAEISLEPIKVLGQP